MDISDKLQDENLGGINAIRFTPIRYVTGTNPITFISGRTWIDIGCTPETGILTEQTEEDENGYPQTVSIPCQVPKIRPEVHAILAKHRGEICIVECVDQNGYRRRAGASKGQIRLYDRSTTGSAVADMNNYTIEFKGRQLETALFI